MIAPSASSPIPMMLSACFRFVARPELAMALRTKTSAKGIISDAMPSQEWNEKMAKILIVEDDRTMADLLKQTLEMEKHSVELTDNGETGLELLKNYQFDAAIVDWEMPILDGVEMVRRFRDAGGFTPILFLTARSSVPEKEMGLDAGADDYLTKPFALRELSARVRSLLRRTAPTKTSQLRCGPIVLDTVTGEVTREGELVTLLPQEFALLEFFLRHPNQLFPGNALLNHVWSTGSETTEVGVRTCITRLRKKLSVEGQESVIHTVHGQGYKLVEPD